MQFPSLLTTSTILLATAMLAFAGCGGGGGGGTAAGPQTPSGQPGGQIGGPIDGSDFAGLRKAATALPRLGQRSITQSSNTDGANVTTDVIDAVYDRDRHTISLTRADGSRTTLDSTSDTTSSNPRVAIRNNQIARERKLERRFANYTITAKSFGEIPNREFPLRSIRAAGNYGTNMEAVNAWEAAGRSAPLVPSDYIAWLRSLHVNQLALQVDLHYDDSMDSTLDRVYGSSDTNTFSDDAIRQFIREFQEHHIDVYLTLAFVSPDVTTTGRPALRWQLGDPGDPVTGVPYFGNILPENWPWRPDHPDHARFVAEFWKTYTDQAVHFARIAEEEGVRMFSLGTETENLFRTRSGGNYWPNHFKQELQSMVRSVREVYSGLLTYDMHYSALTGADHFGTGSDHLWQDLNLDIVGVSAYFEMAETTPASVISVEVFEQRYEEVFQQYLVPLANRNPGKPIVFLEYGAEDTVSGPVSPGASDFNPFVFQDEDGNGIDDGREMQANMFQALINTMERYPGVVNGILWTENWVASDQKWAEHWGNRRGFSVRGKPSEAVVRAAYESWAEWLSGGYWMQVSPDMGVDEAGAFVDAPELMGTPTLPSLGTASYRGIATGGYAIGYGDDFAEASSGSHEMGDYEGTLELTADFAAEDIDGRVHSIQVDGLHTTAGRGTRPINGVSVPYEITLETANFGRGGFTGSTSVTSAGSVLGIASSSGSWGGKFSTVPDSEGNPRLIAGTHGAEFTAAAGTEGSFIGVFVGTVAQ